MEEAVASDVNARMFTTHGKKKNQGKWARVNNRIALAYTEGRGKHERIVGYTPFEDMVQILTSESLPEYKVDF